MSHNPNNKDCGLDYAFSDIARMQQTCTCTPKQDWEERFDKAFVAKGDTVFRSTVESDEVMSFISDLLFQARKEERERVVTEFEEWAKRLETGDFRIDVVVPQNIENERPKTLIARGYVQALTDLLSFADSLKRKIEKRNIPHQDR